jgi:hypothetical protein
MNPLIFMIVKAERDLKAEQEKYMPKYDDIKTSQPAHQPKEKIRKWFSLRSQKSCECS